MFIDRHASPHDAVLAFEVVNGTAERISVLDVVAAFADDPGDRASRVDLGVGPTPGDADGRSRIDPGGRALWSAVCLPRVPPGASTVRIEVRYAGVDVADEGLATATVPLAEPPEIPAMRLPFQGYWRVTQGHGCGSAHRSGGRGGEFAWDFAAIEKGARGRDAGPEFGRIVLSPVDGRIVKSVGDVADNPSSREYPRRSLLEDLGRPNWIFGNHVVIQAAEGVFVLLAHLEQGSLRKAAGDAVRTGDALARVGNSGNTRQPHLHVQVMDRPDPGDAGVRGLPAAFDALIEITAASADGESEVLVRRVARGDPTDGMVVTAEP